MRNIFVAGLLLVLAMFNSKRSSGQSFIGGDLTYDWVADSTFSFTLTLYSICDSAYMLPASASICYYNSCNSTTGSFPLALVPVAQPFGKYTYTGNFIIPSKCDFWTFHGTVPRSPAANLSGVTGIYLEATLNNLDAPTASSPKMVIDPIPYLCVNQQAIMLTGPSDPNGDSLFVTQLSHRTSTGSVFASCAGVSSTISYAAPYDFLNPFPLAMTSGITVNPITGTLLFVPTGSTWNYYSYAIQVDKYRTSDGKKLGSVMRDAQFKTDSCQVPTPTIDFLPNSFYGAQFISSAAIIANANTPFGFCIYASNSPSTNNALTLSSNANQVLPGSTITYNAGTPDSIVGCFSFTPSLADTGNYTIIFTAKDSLIDKDPCNYMQLPVVNNYLVAFIKIMAPLEVDGPTREELIKLYPNPASSTISISSRERVVHTSVYSLDGRLLIQQKGKNSIDISMLSDGMYVIEIKNESGAILKTEKLIKTSIE